MFKIINLFLALLLFIQASCIGSSASLDEYPKLASSSYPVLYGKTDSFSYEKTDSSKGSASNTWRGKLGKVDLSLDVEEPDFRSQCESEWEKMRKNNKPNNGSYFIRDGKDKNDDNVPSFKFTMKWPSED